MLAVGEYISEATEFMSKYNVAEENIDLLTGLESFIKAENTYTDAVQAELQSLPAVFSRMHNVNSFDTTNKLIGETKFAQDYFNNDIVCIFSPISFISASSLVTLYSGNIFNNLLIPSPVA